MAVELEMKGAAKDAMKMTPRQALARYRAMNEIVRNDTKRNAIAVRAAQADDKEFGKWMNGR
jgi:hypothetical protein